MKPKKGKITVVGFGPGGREHMTQAAVDAITSADIVVGYTTYVDMLRPVFPDKEYLATPMMKEIERCRIALGKAEEGLDVAMVSSGDSGIYGMAGAVYQVAHDTGSGVEIVVVPGVTAASAAAAVLGAPLMHDMAFISLSDLMTPLEKIYERVDCAGKGDFVACIYNPRSRKRTDHLAEAASILMRHRGADTPVGVVRHAGRPEERKWLTTLGKVGSEDIDMFCIVVVGNSQTYVCDGLMVTPRGYGSRHGLEDF
ncbi:MAG: precorrin-3B C(17)-methyltransferase [Thermoplasmatales archaeon]|nr:precorrin-3B C(17)-methyltransferase [Thermoplasmatales archaeon]